MNVLAHRPGDGGPGPWIVFFPLSWMLVIGGVLFLVRRNVRRGGCLGPRTGRGRMGGAAGGIRGRAARPSLRPGEIEGDEYRSRMAVLGDGGSGPEEGHGRGRGGGTAPHDREAGR